VAVTQDGADQARPKPTESRAKKTPSKARSKSEPRSREIEPHRYNAAIVRATEHTSDSSAPSETFHRPTHAADPATTLSADQQALDQRLRDWRKAESTRLNAPPFLVLGSSPLRSIVLKRPRTVAELAAIDGITPEAARTFGPAILEICSA
jgi:ATP-dependent DNA helicase RecQ